MLWLLEIRLAAAPFRWWLSTLVEPGDNDERVLSIDGTALTPPDPADAALRLVKLQGRQGQTEELLTEAAAGSSWWATVRLGARAQIDD